MTTTTTKPQPAMKPGDRIGFRTLISPIEAVSGRKRWIVRCDCGRTGSAREDGLRRGIADRCLDCARKTQPRKPGRPYVAGDRIGVFELVDAGDPAQKLLFRRVVAACTVCGAHHERTLHSLTAGATVEAYGCSSCPRMESRRVVLDVLADGTPRRTTDIWRRSGMIRQQRHFQRILDTLIAEGLVEKFHNQNETRRWVYRITRLGATTIGSAALVVR